MSQSDCGGTLTFSAPLCDDARVPGHVVAMGGWHRCHLDLMLDLTRAARPRLLFLATASADDPGRILAFHELAATLDCEPDHVRLFGIPDTPLERIARADAVLVSGGNTANMLAIWRVHGVDRALGAAWERGAVLGGGSAGANCWFEASITDSFGPTLQPLHEGLGLLAGSFCPHYDGEPERPPTYTRLVADGTLPAGIACDDAAAAWFEGTTVREIVTGDAGGTGWEVNAGGQRRLDARVLP
jgi:dipeptidase E